MLLNRFKDDDIPGWIDFHSSVERSNAILNDMHKFLQEPKDFSTFLSIFFNLIFLRFLGWSLQSRCPPGGWSQGSRSGHLLVPPQRQRHRLSLRRLCRQSLADSRCRSQQVRVKKDNKTNENHFIYVCLSVTLCDYLCLFIGHPL